MNEGSPYSLCGCCLYTCMACTTGCAPTHTHKNGVSFNVGLLCQEACTAVGMAHVLRSTWADRHICPACLPSPSPRAVSWRARVRSQEPCCHPAAASATHTTPSGEVLGRLWVLLLVAARVWWGRCKQQLRALVVPAHACCVEP